MSAPRPLASTSLPTSSRRPCTPARSGDVARRGRTLQAWRAQVLAYFDTGGVSGGGTEAINLITETTRHLAHGSRTFDHYRPRILLAASSTRPWRTNHA